jgi:AhpD family alkylhydroperoxidase
MPMLERSVADDPDRSDNLSADLVQLIAFAVSVAAGCRYCQAHTSHQMVERGGDRAKLDAILEFETEPAFSESERTVVAIAMAAGQNPNASTPEMFESLKTHFSSRQIVQIVSIIALFGFLNRWNDTMATALELPAAEFAASALNAVDWSVGKHGSN